MASLYEFYTEHTTALQNIGHSPNEAFWLHFACLPFLPWDDEAENEVRLSQILSLYLSIYRDNIDSHIKPEDETAFIKLLEERYTMVLELMSAENPSQSLLELAGFVLPGQNNATKCAHAGFIVLNTKREWERQQRQHPLPYRLVRDI